MPKPNTRSATGKMARYRARLRAAGLRPVQIWVPDVRSGRLAEELRRQSKRAARRKSEREAITLIDALDEADGSW